MKGYEYIASWFQAAEVDTIFLVPTNLYASLVELHLRDPNIKLVLAHSEKAAAYMADGYAKASGKPGVVITQGGPGATNVLAGLAEPYQSGTPVISLTNVSTTNAQRGNNYQEIAAIFSDTVKFDADILSADRLPDLLAAAFREATTGAPGPVHLGLARIEDEDIDATIPEAVVGAHFPPHRPAAEESAVAEAVRMLKDADRPVIIAGGGAVVSGAWDEITELAERLQIPVGTSLSGKGLIADQNPLSIGPVGSYSRRVANEIVADADLVMYVGAHAGGQLTNSRQVPSPGTPIIHVDINPAQIGKNMPVTLGLIGDARTVVGQLNAAVGDGGAHSEWAAEAARRVRGWWDDQTEYYNSSAKPIEPHRLARDLSATIPDGTIVVADTGYAASWAAAYLTLPTGRSFLRCEGSLGWSFPAALGAKCAVPDQSVVSWTGDGGLWYHLSELETAVRCDIPTVTVVLNNHGLKFDTHLLSVIYGERGEQSQHVLSEFTETNFADIANAMGALGLRVEEPDDIGPTIEKAIESGRPAIVDVVVSDAFAPVRVFQQYASG